MPMLSDIAGITGKYLEGTQAPYNQARKDALRAQLLRAVDQDMVGAQKYLNPDFQERTPEQQAADILASAGPMFSAPQATGAIGFQGQAPAKASPLFSTAQPAPELAQYNGMEKPNPAPVPAFAAPTGLALLTAPQDSLLAPQFRKDNLSGADAASQVKGMLLGTPGAQGASAGGSERSSGVSDEVAADLQKEYSSRSKELSQLDRQDYLDKARLSLLKSKAAQYIDQTKGLGGTDEWQGEIARLEKSVSDRDEQRTKTLQKLNETDQKMITSRSRAAAQNASIQLKRDESEARKVAKGQSDVFKGLKLYLDHLHYSGSLAMRKYEADTRANSSQGGFMANVVTGSVERKAFQDEAYGRALTKLTEMQSALGINAFAKNPALKDKAMDMMRDTYYQGLPEFAPTPMQYDASKYDKVFPSAADEQAGKQAKSITDAVNGTASDQWARITGMPAPTSPGQFVNLGAGSSSSYATGTEPTPAPAPAPAKGKHTTKLPPKGKKKLVF